MSKMGTIHAHMHIGGGSHLPILMKIINMTDGDVLELGMGLFSTPYLHWACYEKKRKLVSYENKKDFYELFIFDDKREINNGYDYHEIKFVENNDWDSIDLSGHWGVVLIDHNPGPRRKEEIKRLVDSADYIVVHDTNGRNDWYYHFTEVFPLFKYRYDTKIYPQTTVLSNLKDLSCLSEME
jgi:hypothetical protein